MGKILQFSIEAVGKHPSAALPSSLVTAAYLYVRLIPRDFVPQRKLRDGHFPSASEKPVFPRPLKKLSMLGFYESRVRLARRGVSLSVFGDHRRSFRPASRRMWRGIENAVPVHFQQCSRHIFKMRIAMMVRV